MLNDRLTRDRSTFEDYCRGHAGIVTARPNCVNVLGPNPLVVDHKDISLAPHLKKGGYWESWVSLAMARMLKPGMNCVDVGSNFGYYTMLMTLGAGPLGHVTAIDANPNMVDMNRESFGHLNVSCLHHAVSNFTGKVMLEIPENYQGSAGIYGFDLPISESFVDVPCDTLDNLIDYDKADLIKIDIEGSEEFIWEGMSEIVARSPELVVFMEFDARRYKEPVLMVDRIARDGFIPMLIKFDGNLEQTNVDMMIAYQKLIDIVWVRSA